MNGKQSTDHASRITHHAWRRLLVPVTILALSLVALQAILRPSLPCSDDAAFHLLRLTQLDHLLRQGVLYSRWAPDMAQGYGFPFFNFYAPLSYYLAEGVSLLVGNLNLGMRLTFALGVYLAGLTAYRLSRDHFSQPAAIVTAVAYMFAPYFAYDILFRGNLAESVAWLFLPLSLWTMGRLARTGRKRWLVAAALSYAAVLLTHNVFALIFSPLLALYGLIEIEDLRFKIKDGRPHINLQSSIFILFSLLLGLGLTAFFWLPALVERSLVHSDRLLVPPIFVYWGNFVTLAEIFTPPQTVYANLINPSPARALGLVPLLLALPALVAGWWRHKNGRFKNGHFDKLWAGRRRQVIFFGLATAVYIFLMTAVSEPFWANLPLIEFVQFPWRLLGPAALCLAVLVGASVDVVAGWQRGRVAKWQSGRVLTAVAAIYCVTLIVGSLYWLDARYCPGLEDPTIADMQEFERASKTIGTTAKGEYLPLTVEYMPEIPAVEPFAPLPARTERGSTERGRSVEVAVLLSASRTPKQFTVVISASEPFTLTANTFDYPGWQATINGEKVDITPSEGTGLITIPVPAGDHDITITFRETPLRLAANLVSLASLVVLLLVASGRWRVAEEQDGKGAGLGAEIPNLKPDEVGAGWRGEAVVETVGSISAPSRPEYAESGRDRREKRPQVCPARSSGDPAPTDCSIIGIVGLVVLMVVGLVLFALVVWMLPRVDTPLRESWIPSSGVAAFYNNNLTLLTYEIAAREMAGDGSLLVQSNWHTPQPVAGDFRETVRLIGPEGQLWSPKTAVSPRWFRDPTPTHTWTPEQFANSQLLIEPIPGTPPGLYTIRMLLFDEDTLVPVPLPDGQTALNLGTVQVIRPQETVVLNPQYPLNHSWDGVTLSGVSLDRETAAPGDPFLLTLYWQVDEIPTDDAMVQLSLVDDAGTATSTLRPRSVEPRSVQAVFTQNFPPVRTDFPTSQWQTGDSWRGQHVFRLPVALESGDYQWTLQWCVDDACDGETATSTSSVQAVLGSLTIIAPERLFTAPPPETEINVQFGEFATLLGINTTPHSALSTPHFPLTLIWQANAETTTSYRVFVHLVDENGQIVAQSDGEPAVWTRPTTGWLPGEIILDEHNLPLENVPSGSYQLHIGLYDPDTGIRLSLANGETAASTGSGQAVTIPEVTIP